MTTFTQFTALLKSKGIKAGFKAAWAVHEQRKARPVVVDDLKRKRYTIPAVLTADDKCDIHERRPRVSRWSAAVNTPDRRKHHWTEDRNAGTYSSRCTYQKVDHVPLVWSECWITCNGRYMVYQYGPTQEVIKAPKGWKWVADQYGPKIINTAGDAEYHPTSLDFQLDDRGVKYCIEQARQNQKVQKERDRQAKSEERAAKQQQEMLRKYPAYACYMDSRKAGNCGVGTLSWMVKQGIDQTHIPINRLTQFKDVRVSRVVQVATTRHIKELTTGLCQLSDHFGE